MKRGRSESFIVHTARGRGSYRSYAKADSAARWVAQVTGQAVTIANEGTGQSWEISVARAPRSVVSPPPVVDLPRTRTPALSAQTTEGSPSAHADEPRGSRARVP